MCSNVNATKGQDDNKDVVNQAASPSSNKTVLLQTIKVNLIHSNGLFKIRALLDSGAQCSFIRSDVVKNLKLQPIGSRELSHNLFGGTVLEKQTYRLFNLNVCSLDGSRVCNIEALEHKTICGNLPRLQQNSKLSTRLRSLCIDISDCTDNISDISMLIGCDFLGSLYTGRSTRVDNNLLAVETLLGWTIQGPMVGVCCSVSNISTFSCTFNIEDFWKLETIGIRDESEVKNTKRLELEVMNFFEKTVRIDSENRYEVRLPWKDVSFSLKSNYAMALKRLMSTTSRLTHLGILNEYNDIFVEWLSTGVIEEVVCDDPDSGFYLPHHAVVKESSLTTKIRPVFDASSKDRNGLSLNVCLEKGKNLIELIPRLLIGFRKNAIGITSDIKKAFLQISLHPDDREYLKFLWWHDVKDKNKVLKVFRHRRVVFGITASPFLLSATILHHLNKFNSDTATLLSKSFYVDNSVVSVKNEIEMNKFISEAKAIMQEGMFELRCWVSGPVMVDEEIETTSVLGLMWNPRLDEIYCKRPYFKNDLEDNLTKRTVLSLAQAIFDPIGFMAPAILILKLVVQQCWILNIDWDQQIPDTLRRIMVSWLREVEAIELCRITRRFSSFDLDTSVNSLHIFCDASQSAYACCIFLRSESRDSVCLQLVLAKSRLAPTKSVTMPRLELLAALMGARLASEAKEGLQLNCKEFYWTDSSIVLAWIKRKSGLNVFVHNRISEILLRTNAEDWHHIPGNMNPADLPSRGCNPEKLRQNRWWNGPDWLRKTPAEWPLSVEVPDQTEVEREVKKSCLTITVTGAPFSQRLTYFSKFSKIVRMIGWCLRLANRNSKSRGHDLTAEEYIGAEKRLLLALQKEDTSILNFNMHTFKDKDNLLRVKTRLTVSRNAEDFISPILLSAKNIIVERLVRQKHIDLLHAGSQTLISNLRETYWIIGIRRLVKRIVRECIICRRFTAKACSVPVAPLPDDRISCSSPFEATGIDLAGPLFLKNGTKCWIVLFTCATFRAVHLELCTSLSTEDFMLSLRRFLARRGKVRAIYSDNGTNLRGASNILDSVNWEEVARKISVQKIAWHFIPPSAPWWGGFWERMVRTLKGILRRVLGKACLHFCELETVICEAEAVINSRPLTYIVDSTENLVPLSPSMFLNVSGYEHNIGFMDHVDGHVLTSRWRYLNKLSLDLKQRFRSEYLSLLVECKKGKPNELFKVGDVVLIGSDDIKRINWPLGIILEIYQGVDGASRVAKIKTVSGERVRALQRLYRLEVSCADELVKATHANPIPSTSETPPVVVTRSGRCVKVPNRLMY